jgi:trk system potassium uptake protein TrkH
MADQGAASLMVAVRPLVLLRYLGELLLVLALLDAVPLAASLALGENLFAVRLAIAVGVLLAIALPLLRLPTPQQIQWNEALAVTVLAFACAPLPMVYPMMAHGVSLIDAWFEALSGATTTGLSMMGSVEGRSSLFLFSRAWMQWYGGLGIAVLSIALLMRHQVGSRRLLRSLGEEDTAATARSHASRVFLVYLGLTLAGLAAIWGADGDFFISLIHTLAAVSTGGFSSFNDSIAGLPFPARPTVTAFAIAGAISLPLYHQLARGHWRPTLSDPELRALVVALVLVGAAMTFLLHERQGLDWRSAAANGLMLGASAQSTAGFSTMPVTTLDPTAKLVLMVSMAVGGCSGSTAGGIKLLRLLILLRLIQLTLHRSAAPRRAVMHATLGGERLEEHVVTDALLLIGLWLMVVVASWLPFLLYRYDPLNSLFEVISAIGTVGLSSGISSPTLQPLLKVVLGIDMLFGRVELVALLVILYPTTWIGRRRARK